MEAIRDLPVNAVSPELWKAAVVTIGMVAIFLLGVIIVLLKSWWVQFSGKVEEGLKQILIQGEAIKQLQTENQERRQEIREMQNKPVVNYEEQRNPRKSVSGR
jgi:hypothetical protein